MSTAKKISEAAIEILRIANGRHRKVLSVAPIARLLEAVNAGDQMAWSSAHLLIDEPALPWGGGTGKSTDITLRHHVTRRGAGIC